MLLFQFGLEYVLDEQYLIVREFYYVIVRFNARLHCMRAKATSFPNGCLVKSKESVLFRLV